jgi:hypothetical protein
LAEFNDRVPMPAAPQEETQPIDVNADDNEEFKNDALVWQQQQMGENKRQPGQQQPAAAAAPLAPSVPMYTAENETVIGPCTLVSGTEDPTKWVLVRGLTRYCTAADSIAPLFQQYGKVSIVVFGMRDGTRTALCRYLSKSEAKLAKIMCSNKTITASNGEQVVITTEYSFDPPHVEQEGDGNNDDNDDEGDDEGDNSTSSASNASGEPPSMIVPTPITAKPPVSDQLEGVPRDLNAVAEGQREGTSSNPIDVSFYFPPSLPLPPSL